jgi:hypothetical protein
MDFETDNSPNAGQRLLYDLVLALRLYRCPQLD